MDRIMDVAGEYSPVIVTGATGAMGKVLAREIAAEGRPVLMAVRNVARGREIAGEINASLGANRVSVAHLDLENRESVLTFVDYIVSNGIEPSALVNNAGIMCREYRVNGEGMEMSVAVNLVGTALLTSRLIPLMRDGANIVFTTSLTRKLHRVSADILCEPSGKFSQLGTYGRSKTGITCFASYLADRFPELRINCADPGIVDTNMITMKRWYDPLANVFFRPLIRTPREGAEAALRALKAEDTGMIYTRRGKKKSRVRGSSAQKTEFINNLTKLL